MEQQRQTTTLTPTIEDAPKSNPEAKVVGDKISEQQNGSSYPQTSGVDIAKPIGLDTSGTDFVDATTPSEVKNEKYIDLPKSPKRKVVSRGLILATTVALIIVSLVAGGGILLTKKNTDKLPIKSIEEQSVNSSTAQLLASTIDSGVGEQQLIVNGDSTFNGDLTAVNIDATETLQVGGETVCTIDGCTIDEALLTQTVVEQVTNSVSITTAGNELTIQGTTDQVIVTAAGDVITLSTPQDLATTSNVAFNNLLLGGTLTLPLDCTVNLSDGSLTTNGSGQVICSDDDTGASAIALQDAYENGNTITTIDADGSILFNLANTAGDQDFIVDLLGTGNTVELRDGGNAFFTASDGGRIVLQNTSDVADAFQIQNDTGGSVFNVDNLTGLRPRVVIGEASNLTAELVFQHSSNSNEVTLRSDNQGGLIITPSNNAAPGVSIAGARGNLLVGSSSLSSSHVALTVQVGVGATADALQLIDSASTPFFTVGPTGAVLLQNTLDSSAAFQIQNQASDIVFNVDTEYDAYTNLMSSFRPDFEADTPGVEPSFWDPKASATIDTVDTQNHTTGGDQSMSITTTAGQNDGARTVDLDLAASNSYVFSIWIRSTTATEAAPINDIVLGYRTKNILGTDIDQDCGINHQIKNVLWTQFVCSFTMGASVPVDSYVYVRRTNSPLDNGITFYVDDITVYQTVGSKIQIGEIGTSGTGTLGQLQFAYDGGGTITLQPVIDSGKTNSHIITIPAESGVICTTSNASVCATGNDGRFLSKVQTDQAKFDVANGKFIYTFWNTNVGATGGGLKIDNDSNTGDALRVVVDSGGGTGIDVGSGASGQFAAIFGNTHTNGKGIRVNLNTADGTEPIFESYTDNFPQAVIQMQANGRIGIGADDTDVEAYLHVIGQRANDPIAILDTGTEGTDALLIRDSGDTFAAFETDKDVVFTLDAGEFTVENNSATDTVNIQNGGSGAEIRFDTSSPEIEFTNAGTLAFTDGTNTLLSLADGGSVGNLAATGSLRSGVASSTNGSLILQNATNAFTVTINAPNQITGSTTISIPNTGADTADTFCLQDAGNCVGVGGSVSGSGTPGVIPVFTGTSAIGDSTLSDDGTDLLATGDLTLQGGDITLGVASTTNGSIILHNTNNAFTATISGANQTTGSATISLPNTAGVADTFCLYTLQNCTGTGSGNDLQGAYEAGSTIITDDVSGNITFNLANTTNDHDFIVDILGTGNSFEVRDGGSPIFVVDDSSTVDVNVSLSVGTNLTVGGSTSTDSLYVTAPTFYGTYATFDSSGVAVSAADTTALGPTTIGKYITMQAGYVHCAGFGCGSSADVGGGIQLTGGAAESGAGGEIILTGGDGTGAESGEGDGGPITITAGDASSLDPGNASGGAITISSGDSVGTAVGGPITLTAGNSAAGVGGQIDITAGAGLASRGGHLNLTAGDGNTVSGGNVTVSGGDGVGAACGTSFCTATVQGGAGVNSQGAVFINHIATQTNTIRIGDGDTASSRTQTIQIGSNGTTTPGTAVSGTTNIYIGNSGSASDISLYGGNGIFIDGTISDPSGNLVIGDAVELGSATTGIRVATTGSTLDIDGNLVLNDQTDIGSATTGVRVATTGSMLDIDGNLVLNDTTDIGSATTGINVATTGEISDIDGNLILDDVVDLGSAANGINITIAGVISDSNANVIINDQTDIGSSTTGIRVATSGSMLDIDGNLVLNDTTDIGSAANGINVATTGEISDNNGNLILDDTVDIGSATTGINVTTAGVITDINGSLTIGDTLIPNGVDTLDLGSTSAEFNQLYLGDGGGISFEITQNATLGYDTTDIRLELSGAVAGEAGLFIEDRLGLGVQAFTLPTAGAATDNLTPTASYVELTSDNAADIAQIQTGSAKEGDILILSNIGATDVNIDQTATTKLSGGADVTLTQYDVMMLIFDGANWLQVAAVTANS